MCTFTATVLAVFATPLFYVLIARVFRSRKTRGTKEGAAHAGAPATHGMSTS